MVSSIDTPMILKIIGPLTPFHTYIYIYILQNQQKKTFSIQLHFRYNDAKLEETRTKVEFFTKQNFR